MAARFPPTPCGSCQYLGQTLWSKGCRIFACLVITVLGVAFRHFSQTRPYVVQVHKVMDGETKPYIDSSMNTEEKSCLSTVHEYYIFLAKRN